MWSILFHIFTNKIQKKPAKTKFQKALFLYWVTVGSWFFEVQKVFMLISYYKKWVFPVATLSMEKSLAFVFYYSGVYVAETLLLFILK